MPTVLDATVVNSAYQTSASARPQRLSNGWLVTSVYDSAGSNIRFYVDKRDGIGFINPSISYTQISSSFDGQSIIAVGNIIYAFVNANGNTYMRKYDVVAGTIDTNGITIDSGQTDGAGIDVISNGSKTELHLTMSTKNATYASSFNIRYAKGTINGDGSVTWGAVEQVTNYNSVSYPSFATNPSISIVNNVPTIVFQETGAYMDNTTVLAGNAIAVLKKDSSLTVGTSSYMNTSWSFRSVYMTSSTYAQSYPSAIFVPQSVNGLANGRIHTFWSGKDATDTTMWNIRYSYSDDGGVTWSTMTKLTSGNTYSQLDVTATANKNNEVFVLWQGLVSNTTTLQVRQLKNVNGVWDSIINKTAMTSNNNVAGGQPFPSTLFDLSMSMSEPLFIYRNFDTPKIAFSGTWTVTTISVTPGSIGTKSDKSNVLTYAITTDGVMSTITEKVNGVTVGTKTATSGQSLIAGLSQAQWDAVRFGKYADVTGGKNTLTVEMGTEKWTYTFDKRLATTDDILSAVKAEQDVSNVFLPAVKSKLASAISAKGGTATGSDSWDALESAVSGLIAKKTASGTATSSVGASTFTTGSGSAQNTYVLTVTGITFKPSKIIIRNINLNEDYHVTYDSKFATTPISRVQGRLSASPGGLTFKLTGPAFVNETSFALPALAASTLYEWDAIE